MATFTHPDAVGMDSEKLAQVTMSPAERDQAAASWRRSMAPFLERRAGPRKVAIDPNTAPATRWNPAIAVEAAGPPRDLFVRSARETTGLPVSDADMRTLTPTTKSGWRHAARAAASTSR